MGVRKVLLLGLFLALTVVPRAHALEKNFWHHPYPSLNYVASYRASVIPVVVGFSSLDGLRVNFYILDGKIQGMINGSFYPVGGDQAHIRLDGVGIMNLNAKILADDGVVIDLVYSGRFDLGEGWLERPVTARYVPLAAAMTFYTNDRRYSQVVRLFYLGVGYLDLLNMEVFYDIYSVR